MNWYYAIEGEQKGPIDEQELRALHQAGNLADESLVWREGMGEWQPYGVVFQPTTPGASEPTSTPGSKLSLAEPGPSSAQSLCSQCGGLFGVDDIVQIEGASVCAACKPAYLQRLREGVGNSDAESIREEHIKHEASVKSIGILYLLGGAGVLLAGLAMMVAALAGPSPEMAAIPIGIVLLLIASFQIAVGLAIRRLKTWARFAGVVLSVIGLLGFPLGTLINGYILYLLLSSKGQTVFTDEYREIVQQTPHIKYRTPLIVWIFLGILLLVIFGAIFAGIFGVRQ